MAGPAQSGLTFDNWGRKLVSDFARPLRTPMYEPRYLTRNPWFPPPPEMVEVASPATLIYRFVPTGPPLSTGARRGATNAPPRILAPATGVLAAAWLTDAQGCVVYRGSAFPSNYVGNVFIADPSAHVIHHAVLRENGLDLTAARAPDEVNSEFVASPDAAFRPVQIVNGPDGALYVADARDGRERGRIYRIVPADFKPPKPPRLGKAKTSELVATLTHPNGWHRDTAARLLYERHDPAAVPLLANLLASSRAPLARLHALHALDGLGALNPTHVLVALQDQNERVREHAVRLSEKLARGGALPDPISTQLQLMAADPSIRVRYQLAWTAGALGRPERAQVLASILWQNPNHPWMQAAILSSLGEGAGDLFVALAEDPRVRGDAVGQEWLRRLATMIGVKGRPEEVAAVAGVAARLQFQPDQAFPLLYALGDGLRGGGSSLAQAGPQDPLQPIYSRP